jgi:hypothetical protein
MGVHSSASAKKEEVMGPQNVQEKIINMHNSHANLDEQAITASMDAY